ncbi:MAG TPA: hypothetical protein VNG93_13065 [Candidatus Dormibacteraeota bacterium]|nr:hypothetical protein [Candidatus Dormibacteraeota bacterium]
MPQPGEVEAAGWARLEELSPAGVHAEDAAHWRSVYRELVATMEQLLETARARQTGPHRNGSRTPATRETEQLAARAEYFRRRLKWWSEVDAQTEDSA